MTLVRVPLGNIGLASDATIAQNIQTGPLTGAAMSAAIAAGSTFGYPYNGAFQTGTNAGWGGDFAANPFTLQTPGGASQYCAHWAGAASLIGDWGHPIPVAPGDTIQVGLLLDAASYTSGSWLAVSVLWSTGATPLANDAGSASLVSAPWTPTPGTPQSFAWSVAVPAGVRSMVVKVQTSNTTGTVIHRVKTSRPQEQIVLTPNGITVCQHGSNAASARPSTSGVVWWIGSVQPTNAQSLDLWSTATVAPSFT